MSPCALRPTRVEGMESAVRSYELGVASGLPKAEAFASALREFVAAGHRVPTTAQLRRATSAYSGRLPIELRAVVSSIFQSHGVSMDRALRSRTPAVVRARDEAVWVVRAMRPEVSYPMLGAFLGRDHSSLLSGMRRFEKRMAADDLLRLRVERLAGVRAGADREAEREAAVAS